MSIVALLPRCSLLEQVELSASPASRRMVVAAQNPIYRETPIAEIRCCRRDQIHRQIANWHQPGLALGLSALPPHLAQNDSLALHRWKGSTV